MTDAEYMKRALKLAEKGRGRTRPNPMVGAVIVKDGKIIGEGFHERFGGPHAERNALAACVGSPKGSTIYVTLEPCCHYGKTPPCTDALIEAGIRRVVVGCLDPNPLVAGRGAAILRQKGIQAEVVEGTLREECERLNEVFFHYIRTGRPFVVLKYAMTMDGKIATYTGESKWITGEAARRRVHEDRGRFAAIMAGVGTVLADDPLLTCRIPGGTNPLRIICDTTLRTPLDASVVTTAARDADGAQSAGEEAAKEVGKAGGEAAEEVGKAGEEAAEEVGKAGEEGADGSWEKAQGDGGDGGDRAETLLVTYCQDKEKRRLFEEAGCQVLVLPQRANGSGGQLAFGSLPDGDGPPGTPGDPGDELAPEGSRHGSGPQERPGNSGGKGGIDLMELMVLLGERGVDSVLLEGGGELNWSALESGIVSKVQAYVAPKIFGGARAKTPVAGPGAQKPAQGFRLAHSTVTKLGEDFLIESEVISCLQES